MKINSLVKLTGLLMLAGGGIIGTTFATSLVTAKTTICVKINQGNSKDIVSLSVVPYYNNAPVSAELWTASENNTCVTVNRDWLAGGANLGTSFFVKGLGSDKKTYLLESRDIAMFRSVANIENTKKIDMYYDFMRIFPYPSSPTKRYVGTVDYEIRAYDKGLSDKFSLSGTYRSDLRDHDAFDAMRQIEATRYTKISDFKGKDYVTREQAAKFFYTARLATHTDDELPTDVLSRKAACTFSDSKSIDPSLLPSVMNACYFGLMKGSAGKFNPKSTITLAEVATVLIRMQYGMQNEGSDPWFIYYLYKAFDVELFDGFAYNPAYEEFLNPISREMIGFMIRRLLQIDNVTLQTYPTI